MLVRVHNGSGTGSDIFIGSADMSANATAIIVSVIAFIAVENVVQLTYELSEPSLFDDFLFIIVINNGRGNDDAVPAVRTSISNLACMLAGRGNRDDADVIVPVCFDDLIFRMRANGADAVFRTVCRASRLCIRYPLAVSMPRGRNDVFFITVSAVGASVQVVAFAVASREDNGMNVTVSFACVLPFGKEVDVFFRDHARSVTLPTGKVITIFQRIGGQDYIVAVIVSRRRNYSFSVNEVYGYLRFNGVDYRFCRKALCRSCGDRVGYTVVIYVPTNKLIGELTVYNVFYKRLTDNLRGRVIIYAPYASVGVIESDLVPLAAVIHLVTVIPIGIIVIPLNVRFIFFNEYSDARNIIENIVIGYLTAFFQNYVFERDGAIIIISE